MIALLIGSQIVPLFIAPIIAPSTVIVQAANPLENLFDFISLGKNTVEELEKAIRVAGYETRETLEKLKNDLVILLEALEEKYQNNLNVTIESLDDVTKKKLLEVEDLVTNVNEQLQADIKLASQEAQTVINTASQEIEILSSELEQSLEEIIIITGETSVYVIERSVYNSILVISLVFLGIGLLLFIWLLFTRQQPRGIVGGLAFFLIAVYLACFSGLAFVPNFRGQVMAYTGVGLEKRLETVESKPRIFNVVPKVIALKKTKEIEISGSTLLLDGQPPTAKIAGRDVQVKAFSEKKIILNVAQLNAPEGGSTNLELNYDEQQKVIAIVSVKLPYIPPPPADLTITNFTITPSTPAPRRNTQAIIEVKNQGGSEAKNFILEWKPSANVSGKTIRVDNLKPGKSQNFEFNSSYTNEGMFDTVAIVDSSNRITESNEANNSSSKQIIVKTRQAKVTVNFTKIRIHSGTGIIAFNFNVNSQRWQWVKEIRGSTYNLGKTFQVTLKEGEKLKIFY